MGVYLEETPIFTIRSLYYKIWFSHILLRYLNLADQYFVRALHVAYII